MRAYTRSLHNLITSLARVIDTRADRNHPLSCNLRGVPWLTNAAADAQLRQVAAPDVVCQTSFDVTDAVLRNELPDRVARSARAVLQNANDAFATAANEASSLIFANVSSPSWPRFYAVRGWDIMRESQRCSLDSAMAYRLRSEWYMRAVVTNFQADAFLPDFQRMYIEEFVRLDSAPIHMVHPLYTQPDDNLPDRSTDNSSNTVLVNTSTILIQRYGKAAFASVPMTFDECPALVEALRLNELAVDQARDAITPSNVAILALPMVMSLLPLSLLAELNTLASLLFIVFTDIFSVLPFLIKGVELLQSGTIQRSDLVAYHVGNPEFGIMEVWAAQCSGKGNFRALGILFISISVTVMALGMALEVLAWLCIKNRERKKRVVEQSVGKPHSSHRGLDLNYSSDVYSDASWEYPPPPGIGNMRVRMLRRQ